MVSPAVQEEWADQVLFQEEENSKKKFTE